MMNDETLMEYAVAAREKSYCPYSGFSVGAAILSADGTVITGCNVENASYGVSCCAERTALFRAVSEGYRKFSAIAIAGGNKKTPKEGLGQCMPCGICRQALAEFCDDDLKIIVAGNHEVCETFRLGELLKGAFRLPITGMDEI